MNRPGQNSTWYVTLPTAEALITALNRRIERISAQIDLIEAIKGVLRERQGKKVDARLDKAIATAIAPILHAHGDIKGRVDREAWGGFNPARKGWRLKWFQWNTGSGVSDLCLPSGRLPDDYTLGEVETVYDHGVHPDALRYELAKLSAYRSDHDRIAADCEAYRAAVGKVAYLSMTLGPSAHRYAADGQPEPAPNDGLIYPLSQFFPGVYIQRDSVEAE